MEIAENMYYGFGEICLAISMADGQIDEEEISALEGRIGLIAERSGADLNLIDSTFKQLMKYNTLTSEELLEQGIHDFHLGDNHLTPQLAEAFLSILLSLAVAKSPLLIKEKKILEEFMFLLSERKRMVALREKGYMLHILIPVDFDEVSEHILEQLNNLENWLQNGFKVTLLHCIDTDRLDSETIHKKKEFAEAKMTELADKYLKSKMDKNHLEIQIIPERFEYLDQHFLTDSDFDFVIMGTHGKEFEDYATSTNTADHVLRHFANYIVLRDHVEIKPIKRILVCTDYNFDFVGQFEEAKTMARAHSAEITLFHIMDKPFSERQIRNKEELIWYLGTEDTVEQSVEDKVHLDIVKYANDNNYDLVVALPYHTSFFSDLTGHFSICKKLIQFCKVPLLVLNNQSKNTKTERLILESH